jgi:SAM-dependent methyltransferase
LFLVADALDPPFSAESFDFVAALNLVDNVHLPLVLLGQMDALLSPGGCLLLGSPYEWRTELADPREWLETEELDAPGMVRRIIEGAIFPQMGLQYEVAEEMAQVPWPLRHHSRHWSLFLVHLIKARKVLRAD